MAKTAFPKPGNFLYPVPAVMVSCQDTEGNSNIFTVAWTGTICSDPPMVYISVRPSRASYALIKSSMEFVINLPDESMVRALDYCGVRSLREHDKWEEMHLTKEKSSQVSVPSIAEAPISIECRVKQIIPLGTHDMFLAEVVAVQVNEKYLDQKGAFHMEKVGLVAYSHGEYYALGKLLGSFGYSIRKKPVHPVHKAKKKSVGKKAPQSKAKNLAR